MAEPCVLHSSASVPDSHRSSLVHPGLPGHNTAPNRSGKNKKPHQHQMMPMRPYILAPSFCPSLHLRSALQSRSWLVFWLVHWEAICSCVCIPPSQVSPVTGSLHEYKLLHIQQRVKLRTLTGFPNLPHLPFPIVFVGDAMQLMKLFASEHRRYFPFVKYSTKRNRNGLHTALTHII